MKKLVTIFPVLAVVAMLFSGCAKDSNHYPGDALSPYIAIYDLRTLYKGTDVQLSANTMFGANKLAAVVVSDHSGKNLPAGLLIVQDSRRLSLLRGIAINIGNDAANYVPGDSVVINIEGGTLTRGSNGVLQITGVPTGNIQKISSGRTIAVNHVASSSILAHPSDYESVLCVIVKAGFNPFPKPTDTYAGDKVLNDGFGNLGLHTEAGATFAGTTVPVNGNFTGIVFNTPVTKDSLVPSLRLRTASDTTVLSSSISIPPVIVAGFMADPEGGDGKYEYIQLIATRTIDFSKEPFSVVTTNNAGASTPTGNPSAGWATGDLRTYKINLTSGEVKKGDVFYVGGNGKLINGDKSTDISSAKWIRSFDYTATGGDGFGTKTSNLLANSGNASGIAVFAGTAVTESTVPVDVIFVSSGGTIYDAGPPAKGFRITNTDWYDIKNPITLADQPMYRAGTNTMSLAYPAADLGMFQMLGGEFNVTLGKWTKARTQTNVDLSKTSTLAEIETTGRTKLID